MEGRWIQAGDENAIAVNNAFWRLNPDLKVGDEIRISLNEKETVWQVVGVFQFPGDLQLISYTSYEYLSRLMNEPNRSPIFRIVGKDHSPAAQKLLSEQVRTALEAHGIQVSDVQTGSLLIEANAQVINIIIGFFLFSSVLVAMVGAIGLAGTMSMNVFERTREIGVMRAIGASTRTVLWMVVVEGMIIRMISWALSAIVAIPISHLLYGLLSENLFQSAGQATLTWDGTVIWFIAAVFLSVIGSLLPARTAARLTVREVLAYE
jgi:putative ABC transport system permease protein